jgi:membrane protease YdiL (CAAX protease family)
VTEPRQIFFDQENRLRNGWWVFIFVGFTLAAGLLIGLLSQGLAALGMPKGALVATNSVIALAATWGCLLLRKEGWASVGFRLNGRWAMEASLGIGVGFLLMIFTALAVLGGHGFIFQRNPLGDWTTLLRGFWLFTWVAIFEETFFRGFLFQRLVDGLGTWPAQLLMAAFFAYEHWNNPGMHGATKAWATVNIALAAILLGLAYLRTRSLALPIGIHLGWNWTQGNILGFGVSGTMTEQGLLKPVFGSKPEWFTGGAFGLEASLPCVLVCGLFIAYLALRKPAPQDA